MKTLRTLAVTMLMLMSVRAYAAPVTLDFTSAPYGAAFGAPAFDTVDQGVGVSIGASAGTLWWDAVYGIGIMDSGSYENDEIEGDERLTVNFSDAVTVTEFGVARFFIEPYVEFGSVMFHYQDGTHSLWNVFTATATDVFGLGALNVSVSEANVIAMTFAAPGLIAGDVPQGHEFSLSSISVDTQPIPEPTTWLLLATGLSALVARRRTA